VTTNLEPPAPPPCSTVRARPRAVHTFVTTGQRSSPAAVEHRRPMSFASPRRQHTFLVCSCPLLFARRHPGVPLVLADNTLPPTSCHRAAGKRATAPSHVRTERCECAQRTCPCPAREPFCPLDQATRLRPTRLSGHYAWQTAAPRGL
jgi:hypothetical protein